MAKTIVKITDKVTMHNKALQARARDPRVGGMLLHEVDISVDANFLAEGRDESGAEGVWPKRKRPKRVKRKTRKGSTVPSVKPGRLLYQDGNLWRSTKAAIHSYKYAGGEWIITKGSQMEYAAIHNYGGVIKHPGTDNGFGMGIRIPPHDIPIPQREFLMVPNPELDAMADKVARFVMK